MLVLHPSSRCDVCLELYTQDPSSRAPHVVPCGHVFCRTCLLAIIPPNCPLCRKPYLPERVKKLIVDKLEDVDEHFQGDNRRENELLRRLMACWDDSDERLVDLTREVDLWLEGRTESHPALKKARFALAEYQRLKSRRERDKMTIKALKEKDRMTSAEQDKTQAIEQSLLTQIGELEKKLGDAETDRNELRMQLAKHKLKNPLPQPPELPVPLNQLTMVATTPRSSGSISLYSVPEAGPSTRRQSQINGSTVQPEHRYITSFYAPNPNSTFQAHPDSGDRKGKRRAKESNGRHSSASVYSNAHSFLSNSHPNGVLSDDEEVTVSNTPFPPNSRGRDDPSGGAGDGSSGLDVGAPLNPYSVAALYIGEYMNGYGEGYDMATSSLDPNASSARGLLPGDSNGEHIWGSTLQDDTPRIRWSRISQEITPYPAQGSNEPRTIHAEHSRSPLADQGNDSSEERLVYHVNGPRQQRSDTTSSNASNVDSNSSYAGGGVTSDSSFSSTSRSATYGTTHHRTSHRTHRRRTTVPGHETDVESVRRREDPRIPPTLRPSSVSVSSWSIHPPAATTAATIATASHTNTHHSQNASNALNLSSFGPASMYPTPPGDTPGSTLSSLGLHSFPLREDDEIVMERLPSTAQGSTTSLLTGAMQTRQRGERRVSFDQRPSIIGAGGSATSIQSLAQGQATTATSTVSALVMTTNANEPSRHAHRRSSGGRHAISHGYSHTGRSTTSARPAPGGGATYHPPMLDTSMAVEDAVHLAAAEMPRPLPRTPPRLRNALGLQLEDNAGRGISAPTPLVPAEGFLRSWSHEQ